MRPGGLALCASACASFALAGCGAGTPLLHPARTLPAGDVRIAGGFSANIALAGLSDGLRDARNEAASNPNVPGTPGSDPTYAKGALVAAAAGPGLAPFVGARVGVGAQTEGGVAYTGRGARVDVRRSFELGNGISFAPGIGMTVLFYGHQDGTPLPDVDLGQLHGAGGDAHALFGWESSGGFYHLWGGARLGYERAGIDEVRSEPKSVTFGTPPVSLTADRFLAGGVLGLAAGFRHVHVAVELDVAYEVISGTYNQTSATVSGLALTPAAALWWKF